MESVTKILIIILLIIIVLNTGCRENRMHSEPDGWFGPYIPFNYDTCGNPTPDLLNPVVFETSELSIKQGQSKLLNVKTYSNSSFSNEDIKAQILWCKDQNMNEIDLQTETLLIKADTRLVHFGEDCTTWRINITSDINIMKGSYICLLGISSDISNMDMKKEFFLEIE